MFRGLNSFNKRKQTLECLITKRIDIVGLQETHFANEDIIDKVTKEWDGPSIFLKGVYNSRGVGILFSEYINVKII